LVLHHQCEGAVDAGEMADTDRQSV
jgi:hypothetical protein